MFDTRPHRTAISRLRMGLVLVGWTATSLALSGCSLFGEKKPDPVLSRTRVYFAPYEEVERAMKQAMTRYPQKIDNPDAGIYETDWVKGDLRFKPAGKEIDYSDGYRYRILVRMVRGKSETKPAIKVIVSKTIELQRDFFAEPESLGSDGAEEMIILYRIQRELALDKAIRRAQDKANQESKEKDDEDESDDSKK